ncbi:hypothetical protein BBBOND_0211970 [Babesia bigemina]|uniref:Uncharacterized protein n=1 Tax=Babesia bigemina TaxID=5866 RepID=A0A061DD88_BABBI|nr:hypothetical protein BBBOND_0211970 [Babesia bigemina]CDR96055.1 hypothetical protein BBBOND_0211970 [Babesia bigemina]|eukprot:XP_012768241.1 hypothetical protein BBBOND_0211970 [Babesia bigemina]
MGDRLMRIGSTKFKDYITLSLIRFLLLAKDRPPDNERQNISRQEISVDLFIDADGGNVASCSAV